jgi:hypothetical protein
VADTNFQKALVEVTTSTSARPLSDRQPDILTDVRSVVDPEVGFPSIWEDHIEYTIRCEGIEIFNI